MEIMKAEKLVRRLMNKHGLIKWDIELVDSEQFAAACRTDYFHYRTKLSFGTIILNRACMRAYNEFQITQVALHEIAHALVDPRLAGEDGGHGLAWEAKARELGYVFGPRLNSSFPIPEGV